MIFGLFDRRNPSQAEITAAHESGHALVAWLSVRVAKINWVDLNDRRTSLSCAIRTETAESVFGDIVISLAGLAGVSLIQRRFRAGPATYDLDRALGQAEKFRRCPDWDELLSMIESSRRPCRFDAAKCFETISGDDVRIINAAFREARGRLIEHRLRFDRLREALLHAKKLDGCAVLKILGPRL